MADILIDLRRWLKQLGEDKDLQERQGEFAEEEKEAMELVNRAIKEIALLRAAQTPEEAPF
jgi:hypothetical protein